MIELGQEGRDKITGFEGVITARLTFLFGCDQYCLTPKASNGELKDGIYFDEGRIEITGKGVKAEDVQVEKKGGTQRDLPKRTY